MRNLDKDDQGQEKNAAIDGNSGGRRAARKSASHWDSASGHGDQDSRQETPPISGYTG